jgi:hypothetical protein
MAALTMTTANPFRVHFERRSSAPSRSTSGRTARGIIAGWSVVDAS